MKSTNKPGKSEISSASLLKHIAVGAVIALIAILLFITGAETQPEWPEFWRLKPLLITPLAGAFGGFLFYLANHLLQKAGLHKVAAVLLCMVGFFIVLWLGIVLGLNGTLWN